MIFDYKAEILCRPILLFNLLIITNFKDYVKSVNDHLNSCAENSDIRCYEEITLSPKLVIDLRLSEVKSVFYKIILDRLFQNVEKLPYLH